jgi:hypothetical protein
MVTIIDETRIDWITISNTISEKTTIVWYLPIALVGALREAPLQKCLYYLLHIIKEML